LLKVMRIKKVLSFSERKRENWVKIDFDDNTK
jgi:hypothetical protein